MNPSDAFKAARLRWSSGLLPGTLASSSDQAGTSASSSDQAGTSASSSDQAGTSASSSDQAGTSASSSDQAGTSASKTHQPGPSNAQQPLSSAVNAMLGTAQQPEPVNAMLDIAERIEAALLRIATAVEAVAATAALPPTTAAVAATAALPPTTAAVAAAAVLPPTSGAVAATVPVSAKVATASVPAAGNEPHDPDLFDYGIGTINYSEDDVDPASKCGVCKMGTDEPYALACGHYPYCAPCIKIFRGSSAVFSCPYCKVLGQDPLKLVM